MKKEKTRRLAIFAIAFVGAGVLTHQVATGLRARAAKRRIVQLMATRRSLRMRLEELRARDPRLREAPQGDVLIGMPSSTAAAIVKEMTAGFLSQITLQLSDIDVHAHGTVVTKTPLGRMSPGDYTLDMRVDRARAVLAPGQPEVAFKGRQIMLLLPVKLAEGEGRATVDLIWDARGVASAVCNDFATRRQIAGRVMPRDYRFDGSFALEVDGGVLVATPRFDDLVVKIVVKPYESTWRMLDEIVDEKGLACRTALRLVNLRRVLGRVLDRGFSVRIPTRLLKPVRLPATVKQEVMIEGRRYNLSARPTGLVVAPDMLWFGSDVSGTVGRTGSKRAPGATDRRESAAAIDRHSVLKSRGWRR